MIEFIGYSGALLIITAYCIGTYCKINMSNSTFLFVNIVGGGCLIGYSVFHEIWPQVYVNVVFTAVSIHCFYLSNRNTDQNVYN